MKNTSIFSKLLAFIITAALLANTCAAQRTNDQDIQDSVIGWWGNNKYDHLPPQTDAAGKRKEAIVNDMVKWMKTSYTPVGGLGTSSRYIGNKGYGVNFLVWNVSHDKRWTDPDGKFRPIPEENTKFYITANQLYGAFPIYFLNTGDDYYFTIQPDGYADNTQFQNMRKGADARISPNCYKYITWVNDWCVVYLTPNNKLPWVPVSRGELLDKAEAGLQKMIDDKKKEAATNWPANTKAQDEAVDYYIKNDIAQYRKNIQALRQKYSSSLAAPAVITDMQATMYSFKTDPDIFTPMINSEQLKHNYPVYKIDAATNARLGDVTPAWVAVAFPFENKERGNQLFEMYTALSQNINYDYIYNYFYQPEKVKGIAYTASNPAGLAARLDAYRNTTANTQKLMGKKQPNMPAGALLFDDFSAEEPGSRPAGWYYNTTGNANLVSSVDGETGHWLKLGYANTVTPTTLKALPENFIIEFDLATGAFTGNWGASLRLSLSGKNKGSDGVDYTSGIEFNITAGLQSSLDANYNYRGDMRVTLLNSPSKMEYNDRGGYFTYAQPEWTSAKRKVHIKLEKKGADLLLYLNGKQVGSSATFKTMYGKDCGDCSINPAIRYTKLTIQSLTQDAANVGCYISNIKIM